MCRPFELVERNHGLKLKFLWNSELSVCVFLAVMSKLNVLRKHVPLLQKPKVKPDVK